MMTLKELRQSYNFTQKELAKLFDVAERTIYMNEKNSTNIKDTLIKKYMLAFGVKYEDIFLGSEYEIFVFIEKRKASVIQKFELHAKNSA